MKAQPQPYELSKEEESMNLLRIQNQKINSLYSQLDQKESIIKKYEAKLTSAEKGTIQTSTLPTQHSYLPPQSKPKSAYPQPTPHRSNYSTIRPDNEHNSQSHPYDTIAYTSTPDQKPTHLKLTQLQRENSQLISQANSNASTIQKLNETIIALNNKIEALLTRVSELGSVITNQENTIEVLNKNKALLEKKRAQDKQKQEETELRYKEDIEGLQVELCERDKTNKALMNDNEVFNEKYEEMNRKLKELLDDNKASKAKNDSIVKAQIEQDTSIQNYKSKLSQLEYVLNAKDNYHKGYITDFENIVDRYVIAINNAIEWGNNNIGAKDYSSYVNHTFSEENKEECFNAPSQTNPNGDEYDYGFKLKLIYENITNMTSGLRSKIREEYDAYEKELQQNKSQCEKHIDQIKDMSDTISYLEQELNQLRDRHDTQDNQTALNEAYYRKSVDSLTSKLKQSDMNLDKLTRDSLRKLREGFSSQGDNTLLPSLSSIELAKDTNPLNAIELLLSYLVDTCTLLSNESQLKKKAKKENEQLSSDNHQLIEENLLLKRTMQSNAKQWDMEKTGLLSRMNQKKTKDDFEREKAFSEEISALKETIANYEEDNERLSNDYALVKSQYIKLEKAYEDLKKHQLQYEQHLLMQNEEMQHKCKELEEVNLKLQTDLEIGSMQLGNLKNALQEQIEQTRETLTNYTTTN